MAVALTFIVFSAGTTAAAAAAAAMARAATKKRRAAGADTSNRGKFSRAAQLPEQSGGGDGEAGGLGDVPV